MPHHSATALAEMLRAAPPRLGGSRLLLIDGPAGAGKSTLANRISVELGGDPSPGAGGFDPDSPPARDAPVQVIHGDDLYEGWTGLATLDRVLVDQVLAPLARGRVAGFRMWDWTLSRRTHTIAVEPRPFLVAEGVGVASRAARAYASCVVYVDAPWELRLARGLARDGEAMRAEWERWQQSEAAYLESEGVRAAADAVVDGASPIPA